MNKTSDILRGPRVLVLGEGWGCLTSEKALLSRSDVNCGEGLTTDALPTPLLSSSPPSSCFGLNCLSHVLSLGLRVRSCLLTPAHFFQTSGVPLTVDGASAPQTHGATGERLLQLRVEKAK